jgi:uncharacterized protein YjbI with pentapeptide repeats
VVVRGAAVKVPKVRPVSLGSLADADEYDIDEDSTHEGLRWADATFADRELRGVSFVGCELSNVALGDADLTAARLSDSRVTRLNVPVLKAPDASWIGTELTASRIGAWDGYGASMRAVHVDGCKVTYANLRGAKLTDVLVTDCTFDELDLMDVSGTRVAFENCTIGVLTAHRMRIENLDLRGASIAAVSGVDGLKGAVMSAEQVTMMAGQFADHLGIIID